MKENVWQLPHVPRLLTTVDDLHTDIRTRDEYQKETGAWVCVSIQRRKMATEAL